MHGLHQGELRITGSRRQIDEQIIELAPIHIPQELLQDLHNDRSAPDGWRVAFDHEAKRDDLHSMRLEGNDFLVAHLGLLGHAQHPRDVGAIDVSVHDPHRKPLLRQRDGEVGGDGRLAHASLSTRNRHDVAEVGKLDGLRRSRHGPGLRLGVALWAWGRSPWFHDLDLHLRDPLHFPDSRAGLSNEGRRIVTTQEKRERHTPIVTHRQVLNHPGGDRVVVHPGVPDVGERACDSSF